MKVMSKIKKIAFLISSFFLGISTKVFASNFLDDQRPFAGTNNNTAYGVPPVPIKQTLWSFTRTIVIPIILLIGVIIYLKKSTQTKLRKFITVTSIIVITAIIYCIVNYLVDNDYYIVGLWFI